VFLAYLINLRLGLRGLLLDLLMIKANRWVQIQRVAQVSSIYINRNPSFRLSQAIMGAIQPGADVCREKQSF
jgi:hypothetical protein